MVKQLTSTYPKIIMSSVNYLFFVFIICLTWSQSFTQHFYHDRDYSPKYHADRVLHYFETGEILNFTRSLILDMTESDYKIKLISILSGVRSNELYESAAAVGKGYQDTVKSLADVKISSDITIYEFLHIIELDVDQKFLYQELYDVGKMCDYLNSVDNDDDQLPQILMRYNSANLIFEGFETFNPNKWLQHLSHLDILYPPEKLVTDFNTLVKQKTEEVLKRTDTECGEDIPFNIKLLQLYQYFVKIERAKFIFAAAAYQVKYGCNKSEGSSILYDMAYLMFQRTQSYMKTVKQYMKVAPREIRSCALRENDDSKYIEIDRFYQMSLKEAVTNIDQNEIITAIAFGSKDDIIYPRIQTSELSSNGYVRQKKDSYTFDWKEFDSTLQNESSDSECIYFDGAQSPIQSINLDDIYLDSGYVVTGVKFVVVQPNEVQKLSGDKTGMTIGLQVRATKFNFKSGKLGESKWVSSTTPMAERKELKLTKLDNPFDMSGSQPDSQDGQYLRFRKVHSPAYHRNLIVPFFDKRSRTILNTYPLGGVGLYHNGADGSAGYISFKLISYDPSKFMHDNLSHALLRGHHSILDGRSTGKS